MDFHGKSSSRSSSSVSASELSQYNTHLILALPSSENLTSNYRNYYSSFAQGLMNKADKKVSLEIPLNTQMKIFAFLFKENYSMSELFSGTREVGYYGESQTFSIGTQTNNLSLGITLIQVPGTGTDTGGGTDNTAPTASVTAATITTSGNAVVRSTETGTAYLVKTTVSVSNNLTSITGAADSQWNSVAISLANTDTNLPATGLADGTYKVYAIDAAGNISSASSNSVTVMDPSLEAFYPFNGNANDESGNSYHGQLGDNVDNSTFPTLTTDRYGNADKAFSFDGNDWIALDKYVTVNSIPEITVCAWVWSTDTSNNKFIISFDRSESYRLALKDGGNTFVGWDTTDSNGSTTTHDLRTSGSYSYENGQSYTIEDGNWHHICGWFNKSSTVDKKIFINGEIEASNSNTHSGRNLGTSDRTRHYGFIGWGSEASSFNGNGSVHQNDFMRGKIDDVRIYSRSLSDEKISALYLREKP